MADLSPKQTPSADSTIVEDAPQVQSPDEVPVTPGVHEDGSSAYFESPAGAGQSSGGIRSDHTSIGSSSSIVGARNPADLLRRLSLSVGASDSEKPDPAPADPLSAHPTLGLTGNLISAAFTTPYVLGFRGPGAEWVISTSFE
jgi:trehalose 6-phosphate synthase/phosphatase